MGDEVDNDGYGTMGDDNDDNDDNDCDDYHDAMAMATARRATARWDTMATTMATGDDNNDLQRRQWRWHDGRRSRR